MPRDSRLVAGQKIFKPRRRAPHRDPRYIEAVTRDPAYDTVFLNMHAAGVGVTLKKIT